MRSGIPENKRAGHLPFGFVKNGIWQANTAREMLCARPKPEVSTFIPKENAVASARQATRRPILRREVPGADSRAEKEGHEGGIRADWSEEIDRGSHPRISPDYGPATKKDLERVVNDMHCRANKSCFNGCR